MSVRGGPSRVGRELPHTPQDWSVGTLHVRPAIPGSTGPRPLVGRPGSSGSSPPMRHGVSRVSRVRESAEQTQSPAGSRNPGQGETRKLGRGRLVSRRALQTPLQRTSGPWHEKSRRPYEHLVGRFLPSMGFGGLQREWISTDVPAKEEEKGNISKGRRQEGSMMKSKGSGPQ